VRRATIRNILLMDGADHPRTWTARRQPTVMLFRCHRLARPDQLSL